MVSGGAVAAIALVSFGMALTPGPNLLYLVSRSITQGRRAGLVSLAGVGIGFLVYLVAATAGIATVFALVPGVYLALKLAGACYLLWLAWQMLRPGGESVFAPKELTPDRPRKLFLMGLLTCLLNPKIAILYVSLLPQFVSPEQGDVALQSLVLGLTQITVCLLSDAAFVLAAGSVAAFLGSRPTWQRVHRYVTGTLLAGFALRLAADRSKVALAAP